MKRDKVAALCGGVGGAKLALGLDRRLEAGALTFAVNTGDDFTHLSLEIWPDFDTVLYSLADEANNTQGWGREGESWAVMDELKRLGGPGWFQLGDKDIALHLKRAGLRAGGAACADIAQALTAAFSVNSALYPASETPLRTCLDTDEGALDFQTYFVARKCAPRVREIRFEGAETARAPAALTAALSDPALGAVIICPSNPYLSIAPILAVPEIREALARARVPRIAVSPLIGGDAVKGPTAKIMSELGLAPNPQTIAAFYDGLIDCLVLDERDADACPGIEALGVKARTARTLMTTLEDKCALADKVLTIAGELAS